MRVFKRSGVLDRVRLTLVALTPALALGLGHAAAAQYETPSDVAREQPKPVPTKKKASQDQGDQGQADQGQGAPSVAAPQGEPGLPGPVPDFTQAPQSYTVQTGDTLWDISQKVLHNPWYWPKVWSLNPQIENPNWIYPGNVITFVGGGENLPAEVQAPAKEGPAFGAPSEIENQQLVSQSGKLSYTPPLASHVLDRGFVTRRELDSAGSIVGSFEPKSLLSTYDEVYLKFRQPAGVKVGDRFIVFRTIRPVYRPKSGSVAGYFTKILGELRVTERPSRGAMTGTIGSVLDVIERGDRLIPWTSSFARTVSPKPNQVELNGVILATLRPKLEIIGESNYVFIDKGRKDGVEVGNTFLILQRGDPLVDDASANRKFPWEPVGMVLVVEVRDDASTGLVVNSIKDLQIGDRAVMRVAGTKQASR